MLKIKLALLTSIMLITFLPSASQANEERTIEQIYKECGPGGVIFGSSSPLLAIISNVTWDLGTTAASSEMSSPETCYSKSATAAVFIGRSISKLEADLAKGEGEYLSALEAITSCETSISLRDGYSKFVQSESYASSTEKQKSEQLFQLVNNKLSSSTCGAS